MEEHRNNRNRGQTRGDDQKRDRQPSDIVSRKSRADSDLKDYETARELQPQDQPVRQGDTSYVNWQSALYVFVLGATCLVLVPLTSFWWIVPVLGAVVPLALAALGKSDLKPGSIGDRKSREQELLHALARRRKITPAGVAMNTSLTVDEASKMLEELARKGHLRLQAEEGVMSYSLRERDQQEVSDELSADSEESESDGIQRRLGASQRLEDPLSDRELEVLIMLASGKTNREVARDLFVSVGTIKSHTGNIYRKLDAKNRTEALARARELKLLP